MNVAVVQKFVAVLKKQKILGNTCFSEQIFYRKQSLGVLFNQSTVSVPSFIKLLGSDMLACENIRFSLLFAAGDVSRGDVPPRETSPAAKSVEKRMFSQATDMHGRKTPTRVQCRINSKLYVQWQFATKRSNLQHFRATLLYQPSVSLPQSYPEVLYLTS